MGRRREMGHNEWSKKGGRIRKGLVTFTGGREGTVIDYVMGDRTAWERVERLEVGGGENKLIWITNQ